jgi:hypothetical protein
MPKPHAQMEDSNTSANASIHDLSDPARRVLLRGGAGLFLSGALAPLAALAAPARQEALRRAAPLLGFKAVPVSTADSVVVPEGYVAQVLAPWGEPVGVAGRLPAFRFDAGNTAAEQALQMGMHHDAVEYFPLRGSRRGLLAINHEYTDDNLLHAGGFEGWSADKVRKSQAAHGVAVIEVEAGPQGWQQVRPSQYARRITAATLHRISGPAAGHALLRTAADPEGRRVLGTINNCGGGRTRWGTYLSCEENFADYFSGPENPDAHARRWGIKPGGKRYRWHEHDARFDAARHPHEPNRFGWVVEINPLDPQSAPVKRTALGRAAHEGATVTMTKDGRAVVYMGEDARFEYIYKFVSRDRIRPGGARANASLLDHGTLYVARFDANGRGEWLPLVQGKGPLTADNGFRDQGEVLIRSRQASDLLGATKMDRPEWIAVEPRSRRVFCTLTNNSQRGAEGRPPVDAANPRSGNSMGHIIEWQEEGDFHASHFSWRHFVLAGDPANTRVEAQGNVQGDAFACPDGLMADARGLLWIQTDMSATAMGKGDLARLGNNMLLAADPATGEVRRFLTGPAGCELTGLSMTPDGRTLFVNIQHPGESPAGGNDPAQPRRYSNWPDQRPDGRPRSATLAIRRLDGGVIGS